MEGQKWKVKKQEHVVKKRKLVETEDGDIVLNEVVDSTLTFEPREFISFARDKEEAYNNASNGIKSLKDPTWLKEKISEKKKEYDLFVKDLTDPKWLKQRIKQLKSHQDELKPVLEDFSPFIEKASATLNKAYQQQIYDAVKNQLKEGGKLDQTTLMFYDKLDKELKKKFSKNEIAKLNNLRSKLKR